MTGRVLLRFLVCFAALYGIALVLHATTSLSTHIHRIFTATTQPLLSLAGNPEVAHKLSVGPRGYVRVIVDAGHFHQGYHILAMYAINIYVLVALVLASPWLRWRQRLVGLTWSAAVILCLNTLIMAGVIWQFDARYPQLRGLQPSGVLPALAGLLSRLSPTGGAFMLPVFLWGFVLLRALLVRRGQGSLPQAAGRGGDRDQPRSTR